MNPPDPDPDSPPEGPRRGPLVALIFVAVLIAGGIWLVQVLREKSRLEDCLISGRRDCAPITAPAR
jgi:hypothetical protein